MSEITKEETEKAQRMVGALLPGVDPTIAEVVLGAILSNPESSVASLMASLLDAPEAVREECMAALFEIVLCSEKGHLFWVDTTTHSLLMGARRIHPRQTYQIGDAEWPMQALVAGPPKSFTIRTPDGARQIWMACDSLEDLAVSEAQATAMGKIMIEAFGGTVIPPSIPDSRIIELSAEAKKRAEAAAATVDEARRREEAVGRCRVEAAEAKPGSLHPGDVVYHEDAPDNLYMVERRANDSWVVLMAMRPGLKQVAPAGAWVQMGPGPFGPNGPLHWCFTEAPSDIVVPPPLVDDEDEDPFEGDIS